MPRKNVQPLPILKAAMALADECGWAQVSLRDIAARADVPFSELYALAPGKGAVIALFRRHIDTAMLRAVEAEAETPPGAAELSVRDRLFDILMARLDALTPYRAGARAVFAALACDPLAIVCDRPSRDRSMRAVLEAAGIDTAGLRGAVRVQALAFVWGDVFRVWIKEGAGDQSKTMARLDRDLAKLDALARRVECCAPPAPPLTGAKREASQ